MKKERRNMEEIDRFIGETFGVSPAKIQTNKPPLNFGQREWNIFKSKNSKR